MAALRSVRVSVNDRWFDSSHSDRLKTPEIFVVSGVSGISVLIEKTGAATMTAPVESAIKLFEELAEEAEQTAGFFLLILWL